MILQDVVLDGIAGFVEHDAVDAAVQWIQVGRGDLVRLDELEIELDLRGQQRVTGQNGKRLAVFCSRHPHCAELLGQSHGLRPAAESVFDAVVGVPVGRQQLQARASADHVVGQREHDAAGVAVVGDFVAGSVSQHAPHVGTIGRVGG